MLFSLYNFLTIVLIFTFTHETVGQNSDDFFYLQIQKQVRNCKVGDVVKNDARCFTCLCVAPGLMKCTRKCSPSKYNRKLHLLSQKKISNMWSRTTMPPISSRMIRETLKVRSCTPELVQSLKDCMSCDCLSPNQMSCTVLKTCARALASLDYLFGDGENSYEF